MIRLGLVLLSFVFCFEGQIVFASEESFLSEVKSELQNQFLGAEIKINRVSAPKNVKKIVDVKEFGNGVATVYFLDNENQTLTTEVLFAANKKSFVSNKRIKPGDKLNAHDFEIREVDVSKGVSYQYRGMMLPLSQNVEKLEARQTILEGQYPLISSVQNMPEIRRGDQVTVYVNSNDVRLSATAVAQEPGSKNQSIRIITQKSKKELTASVVDVGLVEVKL